MTFAVSAMIGMRAAPVVALVARGSPRASS